MKAARGQSVAACSFPDWEFDEHMMVELRDGRLWMLARTKGQPHESFSSDGGKTWSEPRQAATVQNINARFFLRRLKSGRILLVRTVHLPSDYPSAHTCPPGYLMTRVRRGKGD